jgi:hypothetical protein
MNFEARTKSKEEELLLLKPNTMFNLTFYSFYSFNKNFNRHCQGSTKTPGFMMVSMLDRYATTSAWLK